MRRWDRDSSGDGGGARRRSRVALFGALCLLLGGCSLFATKGVVDDFIKKVHVEIDYASFSPSIDPAVLLGARDPSVEITLEIALTNHNWLDLDIIDMTLVGRVNDLVILEGKPEFPEHPFELPKHKTVRLPMRHTIPLRNLAEIPFDVLSRGALKVRIEGSVTGEALGVRKTRKFVVDGVNAKMQPTLTW